MFVDIHNHILPGVDDGARDLVDAVGMARQAVKDGTDTMVATPHRAWKLRSDAPSPWILDHVARLRRILKSEGVPLKIVPGLEIPISRLVAYELSRGELMTLGNHNRYVLIEPPFNRLPRDAKKSIQRILDLGIGVVLAHPERNLEIQQNLKFLETCAALGVTFQLTSGSIVGKFSRAAKETAEAILRHDEEWEIVIASDSHNQTIRTAKDLQSARDLAAEIVGAERAQLMVDDRPRALIAAAS